MPSSDYTNAVGGGLKLKGAKDAGVKKHRKKKTPNPDTRKADDTAEQEQPEGEASTSLHKALADEEVDGDDALAAMKAAKAEKKEEKLAETDNGSGSGSGKTEAQRRHEEMRRKRLDDRLKREGVKTHKERVEELNKYLSGLSEHHDMPRIGPG